MSGEERDYDVWKVKVPKKDKDGKDISESDPKTGGRRRDDGTLAGVPYDFEPFDEDDKEIVYIHETPPTESSLDTALAAFETFAIVIDRVTLFLENHPGVVVSAIDQAKRAKKKGKELVNRIIEKRHSKVKPISKERTKTDLQVKRASNHYENITEEDAKRLVLETVQAYVLMKQNIEILRRAGVINDNIEELSMNEIVAGLEEITQSFPMLMDAATTNEIFDLLSQNKNNDENERILCALGIEQRTNQEITL